MGKKPLKRKPGERLPEGKAKEEILRCVLTAQSPPSTPEIKQYLRKSVNIRSPKTVVGHLDKLKDSGLLIQNIEKRGLEATWSIHQDLLAYEKIWNNYIGLRGDMRKSPLVIDALVEAYKDYYEFQSVPEREEAFRRGASISPTFFEWLRNDPRTQMQRIWGQEAQPSVFPYFALFSEFLESIADKIVGTETSTWMIKSTVFQALFIDYLKGELTRDGEGYFNTLWEEKLEALADSWGKLQMSIEVTRELVETEKDKEGYDILLKFYACLEKWDKKGARDEFKKLATQHPRLAALTLELLWHD